MKKYRPYSIILVCLLFISCAGIKSIDKRHFRNGFYLQRNHRIEKSNVTIQKKNNPENCDLKSFVETKGNNPDTTLFIDSSAQKKSKSSTGNKSGKDTVTQPTKSTPKFIEEIHPQTLSSIVHHRTEVKGLSAVFFVFGAFFLVLAILLGIILLSLYFASLPLGGVFAIIFIGGGAFSMLILGIAFLAIGFLRKKNPDQQNNNTSTPPKTAEDHLKTYTIAAFIFDAIGFFSALSIIGIILGCIALWFRKKNGITDKKSKNKALGAIALGIISLLIFIMIAVSSAP
jgi:hypothetical protein